MKKIGILTFNDSFNYGAVLQMFALYKYLQSNNCLVEVINYQKKVKDNKSLIKKIRSFIWQKTFRLLFKDYIRIDKTKAFKEKYIKYTQLYFSKEYLIKNVGVYNLCIVGSDQVWNPKYAGIDDTWFLPFVKCKKLSYAASFGVSKLDENFIEIYKNGLKNLDKISVREETGKQIIRNLLSKDVDVVVDPVFLLNKVEWSEFAIGTKKEKYILCYYMPGFDKVENKILELAKFYSKKFNLKVINIGKREYSRMFFWEKNLFGVGPQEFIGLIKNAELVVTNSFHGTAFSILFEKQFVSVVESNAKKLNLSSRIIDLLKRLKMEDFIYDISNTNSIDLYKLATISDLSKQIIEKEIQKSKSFISQEIGV